ncbi:DUF817 domain-containing protein [Mechercharimyces sp. CAU 1602]|uniref:DUF817 domain-containing protein n=1 Tax=Mechercharimyces sp. CAU 1602 TaxID=2973933 RepID=UPI002163263B|nr:DUF817 domain-containing protein [Mechercharimyces sp. CAU 1602]MCS1350273.1 DUF817 domain-containing protein [Mechercharimyces sp. CAU 1602]
MRFLATFTYHQALSCLFPGAIFLILATSEMITIPGLYRYDFIFLLCILVQVLMITSKMETWDEVKVILLFHIIGLALELFKVQMGSWSYPEEAWSKIGGVPLYSGFMYASVASYLCQAWRRLHVDLHQWPFQMSTWLLGAAIYVNFFTHHFFYDLRWVLILWLLWHFRHTWVFFKVNDQKWRLPLTISFLLIGFFVWIAENIATFFGAWQYPHQEQGWSIVELGKISSWALLVIISFLIVAQLKFVKKSHYTSSPSVDETQHTI